MAEIQAAFTHEEPLLVEALGLGADVAVNPSGGPLAANPIMATGLVRVAEAAGQIRDHGKHRTLAHSTSGPCLQQNLVCILEGEANEPPAVRDRRHRTDRAQDEALGRVVRRARARGRIRALDDAEMTWSDIDAVVVGKAPDLFEGVMKPELYLTDALGAAGKPMFRVHTAGSVGGTTGIVAAHHVETGPPQARARGRAREAVGGQRAVRARLRPRRVDRRRWCVRAVHARLHPAHRRAARHRPDGRGEGPPERAEEPVRAPEDRRHLHREGEGVADDVGPGALPRVVPVVRRRVRGGVHRRGRRQGRRRRRPPAGVDPRLGGAIGAVVVPGPRPGAAPGRGRLRVGRLRAGRHHRPARSRSTAPSCTCRSAGTSRCGSRPTTSPRPARAGRWSSGATPRSTARSR